VKRKRATSNLLPHELALLGGRVSSSTVLCGSQCWCWCSSSPPRYEQIFKKLEEKGELSQLTHWLMAFDRLNAASFYLAALLLALAVLVVDEAVVRILRRKARGNLWPWLWVAAVALAAIPAVVLVVSGLLLPVFKMSSTVP
jgi:hypothetical protein